MATPASATAPTRRDDAYHLAQFADGQHDANDAEWWSFNLNDPSRGLQLAVTYAVIDPSNLTGFGLSSAAAIAYTPAGNFTETAVYPSASFQRLARSFRGLGLYNGSADATIRLRRARLSHT